MSTKKPGKPLALGPDDLAQKELHNLDYRELRDLLNRHLAAHLPVLVEDAVASAVEPIADTLVANLREAVLQRLEQERATRIDDVLDELHQAHDS